MMSEFSLAPAYYSKAWPLFAHNASLIWQGIAEAAVGLALLGYLNDSYATKENMGKGFHTLLIAAGVIDCIVGVLTFIGVSIASQVTVPSADPRSRSLTAAPTRP